MSDYATITVLTASMWRAAAGGYGSTSSNQIPSFCKRAKVSFHKNLFNLIASQLFNLIE